MFEWMADPSAWMGLLTLLVLEIVLGIDNIIFISILAGKLPEEQRAKARNLGLLLALVSRIILLLFIGVILGLDKPITKLAGIEFSIKSFILLAGGLFLIGKAVHEIHHKLEGDEGEVSAKVVPQFQAVIFQIILIDFVFSVDSILTAIGMVKHVMIMIIVVIFSTGVMMLSAGTISGFVERHPTVKMLALAFLILIGMNLIAEATHHPIPKGYTYFAMAFSVGVEMLNLRLRVKSSPVHLRQSVTAPKLT